MESTIDSYYILIELKRDILPMMVITHILISMEPKCVLYGFRVYAGACVRSGNMEKFIESQIFYKQGDFAHLVRSIRR